MPHSPTLPAFLASSLFIRSPLRLRPYHKLSSWASPDPITHPNASSHSIIHAKLSTTSSPSERLSALRSEMSSLNLDAFIIPSSDPHNSEYVAACFKRREYISGFTGSAGTAVVLKDKAYLWTDGRYTLQAGKELDEKYWKVEMVGDGVEMDDWLGDVVGEGGKVGVDPMVVRVEGGRKMKCSLEKSKVEIVEVQENLVDRIWKDRPEFPTGALRVHPIKYSGVDIKEKLKLLRAEMEKQNADALLVSMLDEVAWVLNIRGDDIPHCPVALAYLLVEKESTKLFIEPSKIGESSEVAKYLEESHVQVLPYEKTVATVKGLADDGKSIWMDNRSTSLALSSAAGDLAVLETSPIPRLKAIKNQAELNGMKQAHLRDGAAVCSFLYWLEQRLADSSPLTEVEAGAKLEEFRAQQSDFLTTSFDTIAGVGPNGAIIHYSASPGTCRDVTQNEMFLLDSGGQYIDGTTDITRTMHFGKPSKREKECYTSVLKGHIALDTAVFPERTTGFMLDTLARAPLWSLGLDYRHGTGHGVGACLNVHEGPQSISPRVASNRAALEPGMIVSNEPGYYEEGQEGFGIRIENLLYVVEKQVGFGGKKYLGFERLTFVPIDSRLLDFDMLTASDRAWLNEYHVQCWEKISPLVSGSVRDWLHEKTRPLRSQSETPVHAYAD